MRRVGRALLVVLLAACDEESDGDLDEPSDPTFVTVAKDAELPPSSVPGAADGGENVPTEMVGPDAGLPPDSLGMDAEIGDGNASPGLGASFPAPATLRSAPLDASISPPDGAVEVAIIPDAQMPDAAIPDADVLDAAIPDGQIPDAPAPDAAIPDANVLDAEGDKPDAALSGDAALEAGLAQEGGFAEAGADAGTELTIEKRLLARLYFCNALGQGEFHPQPIVDDYGRCLAQCVIAADCSDVRFYQCGQVARQVLRCQQQRCPILPIPAEQQFACGDGQVVWTGFQCDGLFHCDNRADESNCGDFLCADGSHVFANAHCNGKANCADKSDEVGCASACPPQP